MISVVPVLWRDDGEGVEEEGEVGEGEVGEGEMGKGGEGAGGGKTAASRRRRRIVRAKASDQSCRTTRRMNTEASRMGWRVKKSCAARASRRVGEW